MILILIFSILTFLILTQPNTTLYYAMHGLTLWYSKMVPILLPFMILSGILIKSGNSNRLGKIFSPLINPIFRCNPNLNYGIVMGFLCGFPMGAKVSIELLDEKHITPREAAFLLSFCNNIGPVYIISYLLPMLNIKDTLKTLIGLIGIPFLYGIILRYTMYKDINLQKNKKIALMQKDSSTTLLNTINTSIQNSLQSIIMLCGYMVLCNLLMLIPHYLVPSIKDYLWPFIELNGGVASINNTFPYISLVSLIFGGMCCFLQTFSIIKNSSLSIREYILHKTIQGFLAALYFAYLIV